LVSIDKAVGEVQNVKYLQTTDVNYDNTSHEYYLIML